jgi:phage baseplate assembly protein W
MIIDFNKRTYNPKGNPWIFKDLDVVNQFRISSEIIYHNRDALDERAIQQSINNIFTYKKGERPLKPDFGNTLYEYLYEPINTETSYNIKNSILSMLAKWEPRIDVLNVNVIPNIDANEYIVQVYYEIPALKHKRVTFTRGISQLTT